MVDVDMVDGDMVDVDMGDVDMVDVDMVDVDLVDVDMVDVDMVDMYMVDMDMVDMDMGHGKFTVNVPEKRYIHVGKNATDGVTPCFTNNKTKCSRQVRKITTLIKYTWNCILL